MAETHSEAVTKLIANALNLGKWQKMFLTISVLMLAGGTAGQFSSKVGQQNIAQVQTEATSSSSRVEQTPVTAPPAPDPTLVEKLSPWATRVGASFAGGFL